MSFVIRKIGVQSKLTCRALGEREGKEGEKQCGASQEWGGAKTHTPVWTKMDLQLLCILHVGLPSKLSFKRVFRVSGPLDQTWQKGTKVYGNGSCKNVGEKSPGEGSIWESEPDMWRLIQALLPQSKRKTDISPFTLYCGGKITLKDESVFSRPAWKEVFLIPPRTGLPWMGGPVHIY